MKIKQHNNVWNQIKRSISHDEQAFWTVFIHRYICCTSTEKILCLQILYQQKYDEKDYSLSKLMLNQGYLLSAWLLQDCDLSQSRNMLSVAQTYPVWRPDPVCRKHSCPDATSTKQQNITQGVWETITGQLLYLLPTALVQQAHWKLSVSCLTRIIIIYIGFFQVEIGLEFFLLL